MTKKKARSNPRFSSFCTKIWPALLTRAGRNSSKYTISAIFQLNFLCNITTCIFPKVWYNKSTKRKGTENYEQLFIF